MRAVGALTKTAGQRGGGAVRGFWEELGQEPKAHVTEAGRCPINIHSSILQGPHRTKALEGPLPLEIKHYLH